MRKSPDLPDTEWRKSSYSGSENGDCVEVAQGSSAVSVRDSKNPRGGAVVFCATPWAAFLEGLKVDDLAA
ncbi:DUF397 domain-containing protein [Streptomyces sp. XM4193]|uniref:DUF397 domain-containing protein n=1 Tax=Streptomyces sp. XM4193 TaxID=2929782 RepID=UPI001FF998C7|nr:DUF397 domain-containing protein [Streptomyces sp. XM4193]MCK1798398.1 DUF397 domain-containing protein [Streptomyces sp. XM4193]